MDRCLQNDTDNDSHAHDQKFGPLGMVWLLIVVRVLCFTVFCVVQFALSLVFAVSAVKRRSLYWCCCVICDCVAYHWCCYCL